MALNVTEKEAGILFDRAIGDDDPARDRHRHFATVELGNVWLLERCWCQRHADCGFDPSLDEAEISFKRVEVDFTRLCADALTF